MTPTPETRVVPVEPTDGTLDDDRIVPLLMAQAATRGAHYWNNRDQHQLLAALLAKLDAAPAAPAPEPVVHQWRYRPNGTETWTSWQDGVQPPRHLSGDIEERDLYATPPAPVAASAVDLSGVRRKVRAALGAIGSNQVEDKDAYGTLTRALAELDAIIATPSSDDSKAVRVRGLEWKTVNDPYEGRGHYGTGVFGHWYVVSRVKAGMWAVMHHVGGKPVHMGAHPTLDAAKADAQADYERRIRACLETGVASRRDVWAAAARSMLAMYEGPAPGCSYDPIERADKDRVINAGCYAAEAYEFGTVDRDHATVSLIHAFLISLFDIADPRLDYLRAGSPPPPAAEEG